MKKSDFNLEKLMKEGFYNMKYSDVYKIISKPWASTEDIKNICQCGNKKAISIRKIIENEVINKGKTLPISCYKSIPTPILLKYLNIDIDYVFEMAKKEKELEELL